MQHPFLFVILCWTLAAADHKPVYPAGSAKPTAPFSPGIAAGNYLYIAGQVARKPGGPLPGTIEEQIAQTLENVKAVAVAGGLTMQHIVHADVYLANVADYDTLNKVWGRYFPRNPPSRSVIGVKAMPVGTPVEISAVAVRDLKLRRSARIPAPRGAAPIASGVMVENRFYLGGIVGRDFKTGKVPVDAREQVDLALERASVVLRAAGLELRHLVSATIYIDASMPMDKLANVLAEVLPSETAATVVRANALPFDAHFEIAGVASRMIRREGSCSSIGETLYCPARAGSIESALKYVQQDLSAAKATPAQVVSATLFIDSIDSYNSVNAAYAKVFAQNPPARVTLQPADSAPELSLAPSTDQGKADGGPMVQLATVVVR